MNMASKTESSNYVKSEISTEIGEQNGNVENYNQLQKTSNRKLYSLSKYQNNSMGFTSLNK